MRYRDNVLYYQQALDDTGTFIENLRFRDPLSALSFKFAGTAGATSNKANWMSDVVTKVEIVDGSDVLLSASIQEIEAMNHWLRGEAPVFEFGEAGGNITRNSFTVHFGRWLWDKDYYLDLSRYNNPQLRVTTDEDVILAMGAAGFLSGSFDMSVCAHIMEQGANPSRGFVMMKEINSFTAAASGDKRVDLPRDYPYLGILLHTTQRTIDFNEAISRLKLTADTDKYIPFDRYTNEWLQEVSGRVPWLYNEGIYLASDTELLYNPINYEPKYSLRPKALDRAVGADYEFSGTCYLRLATANTGVAMGTDEQIHASVQGSSLHASVPILFGLYEPEQYFNPGEWGDLELVLTQAGAYAVKITAAQMRA